ncbi:MAG: oxidoreductase [Pseudomonadota bacterium]
MSKPKVALYWCASCGGCEETVVDLNENVLKVTEAVDIVFWPVALDFKRKDVEALGRGEIAVAFINGAIRTSEQEEMVKMLREKAGLVVAFGSCAHLGGIPGLANFWDRNHIFERVYGSAPTVINPGKTVPQQVTGEGDGKLYLPEFFDTVKTLDQVIDTDYFLPGCPPTPDLVMQAVTAILEGKLPEKGSVLAPEKPLCDSCPRSDTKPVKMSISEIKRPHEVMIDPYKCFLEQGIICLGLATRSGCGEACINANMPCRGCFGPTKEAHDQGAGALSALASLLGVENEEKMSGDDIEKLIDGIVDPAGTFYRFSLPASTLGRRLRRW